MNAERGERPTLNGIDLQRLTVPDAFRGLKDQCAACKMAIEAGEAYTLIRVGPGPNPIERQRAREGTAYNAIRVRVHWACATGEED